MKVFGKAALTFVCVVGLAQQSHAAEYIRSGNRDDTVDILGRASNQGHPRRGPKAGCEYILQCLFRRKRLIVSQTTQTRSFHHIVSIFFGGLLTLDSNNLLLRP